jgi:hypothetical protein
MEKTSVIRVGKERDMDSHNDMYRRLIRGWRNLAEGASTDGAKSAYRMCALTLQQTLDLDNHISSMIDVEKLGQTVFDVGYGKTGSLSDEDAREPSLDKIRRGSIIKHIKRGTAYVVIDVGVGVSYYPQHTYKDEDIVYVEFMNNPLREPTAILVYPESAYETIASANIVLFRCVLQTDSSFDSTSSESRPKEFVVYHSIPTRDDESVNWYVRPRVEFTADRFEYVSSGHEDRIEWKQ